MTAYVAVIETPELGDRSYLAHDGTTALVIDPQRDVDRVIARLAELGLELGAVAETHIHNDYLTGGLALADRYGVPYLVAADEEVVFDRLGVSDGDVITIGGLSVRVVATPGHTPAHLSYLVSDPIGPAVAFTGGSLLYGAVGRTDLIEPARTNELARAQYQSAHRLVGLLPDDAGVFPTHGFGSFCSGSKPVGGDRGTIGEERDRNLALTATDEDSFVTQFVAGFGSYPAYYVHISPRNRVGVRAPDLSPASPLDPADLKRRIAAGEWVVDVRPRSEYAADHLAGTIGVELNPLFGTYLGWIFDYDAPLTLIGATDEQLAAAQRQLVRIGIDRPSGVAAGDTRTIAGRDATRTSYPVVAFADLPADLAKQGGTLLDVRREDELPNGRIEGALHVPLAWLLTSLDDLPAGTLWVHCASGFRASIAASVLDRAGRDVVLIDDEFGQAIELGIAA